LSVASVSLKTNMKNAQIVVDIQNDYFPGGAFPREESMLPVKPVCVLLRKHVKQGG